MKPNPLSPKQLAEALQQMKQQVEVEKHALRESGERVRAMAAENKRLEIELIRYRDHFEALVASRTAELMAINAKLIRENRERRLAERERRSFEDQFREASLLLETVLNAIPDIIGVQDINHRIIRFNKAGYEFFGKPQEEVIGKRCFELIGQQAPCDKCVMHQLFNTSENTQIIKYLDDRGLWMDIRAYPILDMDGRVVRIVEHWRDITSLKKSEASLKESEEKYRLLVENANAAIFIYRENEFRFTNRIAREMGRRLGMEDMYSPVDRFVHRDDLGEDPKRLVKRLNGGEKRPYAMIFRLVDKQGDEIWVELNTVNITWEGSPATLNFIRDITRSKRLEQRFQEAQRIESLGTLAGGIAHDFNNLLMGIQGNVSLMYLDMDQNHHHFDKIKSIEDCVESGSRLTKQLLGFARGGKYVVKPMDMNQIVRNSVDMFGRTRKAIKIHDEYGEDLWTVMVDRSQIEQVLVNLYLNAWQAMQGTGDLFLTTGNVELNERFVRPFEVRPGRFVRVSVRDTGIGMTDTTQRRIFEPFFTTHEPGRGTGLGLASVFGIIKNHNGFITVKSRLGEGSTFEFYLPATHKKPKEEKPAVESIQMGSERILLVDDEDYILDVGRLMLEGLGYTIVTANGGRDAIKSFAEQSHTIKLVILDLVMPDLDGENVFHEMRKIRPDIKVLFASGHYVMEQTRELLRNGSSDFLQKPFNMRQLSNKIRVMLDK
jgi:two-component system, cell cycle sensor histidine kinase and response regulator CckA